MFSFHHRLLISIHHRFPCTFLGLNLCGFSFSTPMLLRRLWRDGGEDEVWPTGRPWFRWILLLRCQRKKYLANISGASDEFQGKKPWSAKFKSLSWWRGGTGLTDSFVTFFCYCTPDGWIAVTILKVTVSLKRWARWRFQSRWEYWLSHALPVKSADIRAHNERRCPLQKNKIKNRINFCWFQLIRDWLYCVRNGMRWLIRCVRWCTLLESNLYNNELFLA